MLLSGKHRGAVLQEHLATEVKNLWLPDLCLITHALIKLGSYHRTAENKKCPVWGSERSTFSRVRVVELVNQRLPLRCGSAAI